MNIELDKNAFSLSVDIGRYNELCRNLANEGIKNKPILFNNSTIDEDYRKISCKEKWYTDTHIFNVVGYSHYLAIKKAKEMNLPYAIIYEDDAYPCDGVVDKFNHYMDVIDSEKIDFGCIVLGRSGISCECRGYSVEYINDYLLKVPCRLHGAHAYLVKNDYFDAAMNRFHWHAETGNHIDHAACDFNLCYPPLKTICPIESLFFQKNGKIIKQPEFYDINYLGKEISSTHIPVGYSIK